MSEQSARLVDQLRARLRATVQRMTLAEAAFGAVITLGALAGIWLLVATVEAGFWLGTTARLLLIGSVAVAALGLVGYFLARPLFQLIGLWPSPSDESVARRIGHRYPEVSDRLVNVLQLAEGRRSTSPDDMVDRAVQSLGREVESVEFEQIEDFSQARRASRLATLPIVGLLVFLIAAPSTFLGASQRLLAPGTSFERPAPFQLQVTPGDTDLVRGDSLQIVARATGQELPQTLALTTSQDGEEVVDRVDVPADAAGVFRHTIVNVRQSMRYRVQAPPVESRWYTATVEARPLVRSLQVSLSPPPTRTYPIADSMPTWATSRASPARASIFRSASAGPRWTMRPSCSMMARRTHSPYKPVRRPDSLRCSARARTASACRARTALPTAIPSSTR